MEAMDAGTVRAEDVKTVVYSEGELEVGKREYRMKLGWSKERQVRDQNRTTVFGNLFLITTHQPHVTCQCFWSMTCAIRDPRNFPWT